MTYQRQKGWFPFGSIWGAAIALAATAACGTAHSQSSPEVASQNASEALGMMLRTPGLRGDRCSIGVDITGNGYVTRIFVADSRTKFMLGDRVVSVNGETFEGLGTKGYEVFGRIAPTDAVRVSVQRSGQIEEFEVQCVNARPYTDGYIRILESVRGKKWADCLTAIQEYQEVDGTPNARVAGQYRACSWNAGKVNPADAASANYEYLRLAIQEEQWDPIIWPNVRGQVISRLVLMERNGQGRLAADLQIQIDAVDRRIAAGVGSSSPAPGSVEGGATGTGFLVDGNGTIVTSNHVIAGATSITVHCGKSAAVPATVAATNQSIDIAVLSSGTKNSSYLSLARRGSTSVGQQVFTYGFPVTDVLGGDPKFTDGAVSALSGIGGEQTYLQISIPVQPGNSGGPVVNEKGEVVGIVAAGAAITPFLKNTGTLPQNVNWAVKAEYAALMFDAPPSQPVAPSREVAIKRVEESVCYIEAR